MPSAILVTGAAGFIGSAVALRLLERGDAVVGLDNFDPYYEVALKESRFARLLSHRAFDPARIDIGDHEALMGLFDRVRPRRIVHLASQVGVRYSVQNPRAFIGSNVAGFLNILEGCRRHGIDHLVFASSSSVYGANEHLPYSVHDNVDHPVSLYAATKKAMELMAHSYSHLYRLPASGLRFFTVYGPWGRPDMAVFSFTRAILAGEAISLFNEGRNRRDFTYVDDIVEGVVRVLDRPAVPNTRWNGNAPDPATSLAPYRLYNIGNHHAVDVLRLVQLLELSLDRKARVHLMPPQPGDVEATFADVDDLARDVGFQPATPLEVGIPRFVDWFRQYYGV
jgi:UDP-glucuronate 4-epimerase